MIKLKKIVAIALAATMCMGLSMTAFASSAKPSANNSVSELDQIASPTFASEASYDTSNGTGEANDDLDVQQVGLDSRSKTWESINTTPEVLDILAENGLGVPKGSTIIPIDYVEVTGLSEDQANVITFTLAKDVVFSDNKLDADMFHAGDTIYAMMETGENTGVWEMVPGTLNDKGEVDFTVDHKGVIILVKAMKNGKLVQFTKDSNGGDVEPPVIIDPTDPNKPVQPVDPNKPGTSTNPSNGQNANGGANAAGNAFTSPKTGEF